jgi:arylsulfatase A-like enzyme
VQVLFLLADDMGWADIGYHEDAFEHKIATPHLDALARDGIRLTNYYTHKMCTPTRAALMTVSSADSLACTYITVMLHDRASTRTG